jgi:MSHA biogenesis protein MshG
MPLFHYQGRNQQGQLVQGERESASADAVSDQLSNEGIIPLHITAQRAKKAFSLNLSALFAKKVSSKELLIFSRQMYTLCKAGIPVVTAIKRLTEIVRNPTLLAALEGIERHILSGQSLTNGMQHYPKVFSNLFIELIKVGEESGQLEDAFLQIANYIDLEVETVKRVKSALRYPMMVIMAISAAVVIINIFVIPNFAKLFASFHTALPLPTRILLATSGFMARHWLYLLLGAISLFFGLRYFFNTARGKFLWHKYQFRLPIIGDILKRVVLARFARSFAVVLHIGMPLHEGIELVANAVDNSYARKLLLIMRQNIEHGRKLSAAFAEVPLFTPLVLQMLTIGEETGAMDTMLEEVAAFYDREVDYDLKSLAEKIEPLLLLAVAGMVLILALGVFLPMWDMAKFAG